MNGSSCRPGQEPLKPDTTIILYDSLLRPSVRHEYHLHSFRLGKNRGFRSLIDKHKGVTTELKMDYTEIAFSRILWAIYGIDKEIKVNIISLGDLAQIYEASLRFELPELGWKVLPDLFADIGENFSWEKVARSDVVDVLSYLDPQFGNRAFHQLLRNEVRKRAIEFSERLPDGLGSLKMLCPRLWKDLEER